jgi:K+:H+ antiporter
VTLVESSHDIALPEASDRLDLVIGNAASPHILEEAAVAGARMLMVAIPETFEAGQIIEQARKLNPGIQIVARAHSDAEVDYLTGRGADRTIMGEEEIARRMTSMALAVC